MKPLRLYFAAVSNRYGQNVFIPYAAGLMWAYARKFSEIAAAYEMCGILYLKEPIDAAVARLESPDVLALSSYIWNHEWNKAFATAVKKKWPDCVIIVGGVQVPDESPRILEECAAFDFGIYGEGEGAFADLLKAIERTFHGIFVINGLASIGSLIWWDPIALAIREAGTWNSPLTIIPAGNGIHVNPRHAATPPDEIPSPYLEGIFDELVDSGEWKWQALHETNRGCPFHCVFCAWGASALSKLRQFSAERILAEYEWFGKHKIEFIFNCDANYAILKRDSDLTDALIATKLKYGYPKQFRACFAKNSNDIILDISRRLTNADMHKATTLALQSLNEESLGLIKRKNIRYDRLAELAAKYEAEGIPTFTEIIIGMPSETLSTFIDGLDKVLEAHIHDGISIYLCVLLENTEMNTPAYIAEHGIESVQMKALLYHGTPEPGAIEEIQPTVIATKTMPRDELKQAWLYGCVVQACHGFGLTQYMARTLHRQGIRYQFFYRDLLKFFQNDIYAASFRAEGFEPHVGYRAIKKLSDLWDGACEGKSWTAVDPRFGDVSWPPEELLFLEIACNADDFYEELKILGFGDELVDAQRARFIPPIPGKEEEYAREAVWFGRKGQGKKLRMREFDEPKDVQIPPVQGGAGA